MRLYNVTIRLINDEHVLAFYYPLLSQKTRKQTEASFFNWLLGERGFYHNNYLSCYERPFKSYDEALEEWDVLIGKLRTLRSLLSEDEREVL